MRRLVIGASGDVSGCVTTAVRLFPRKVGRVASARWRCALFGHLPGTLGEVLAVLFSKPWVVEPLGVNLAALVAMGKASGLYKEPPL